MNPIETLLKGEARRLAEEFGVRFCPACGIMGMLRTVTDLQGGGRTRQRAMLLPRCQMLGVCMGIQRLLTARQLTSPHRDYSVNTSSYGIVWNTHLPGRRELVLQREW